WQTGNRNAARMNEDDLTVRLSRLFDMALPPWRRWHAPRKKPRAGRWHPDAALSRYGPDFRSNFTGRRTALDRETMIGCAPRCLFQLELGEDGVGIVRRPAQYHAPRATQDDGLVHQEELPLAEGDQDAVAAVVGEHHDAADYFDLAVAAGDVDVWIVDDQLGVQCAAEGHADAAR